MTKDKITWLLKEVKLSWLKEWERNPRTLSDRAKKDIKASIDKFGLIDKPMANLDGTLIGGHQRVKVLSESGEKSVLCWLPSRKLTDKEIEELNIRLNANQGDWNSTKLKMFDTEALERWGIDELQLGELNAFDDVKAAKEADKSDTFDGKVLDELRGVQALKQFVRFASTELYEIPMLIQDKCIACP